MSAPTYVPVRLANGAPVDVRVLSLHEDDDLLREEVYRAEARHDYCNARLRKLEDAGKNEAEPQFDEIASLERARDVSLRKLFDLVVDKPDKEARLALLRSCSISDAITIFLVSKGENPRLNAMLQVVSLNWDDPEYAETVIAMANRWMEPELRKSLRLLISPPPAAPAPPPS